jgi:hypothetical protein
VAIAHQVRIAAERAATARDVRRAQAARSAGRSIARAQFELERLILVDRAATLAAHAQSQVLPVPGTITPVERAWVLCWHLLAASARLHGLAFDAGHARFGERQTADALALIREALRDLESLLDPDRRLALRTTLTPSALSLESQWRLFRSAARIW